jgi:hypothetical protein
LPTQGHCIELTPPILSGYLDDELMLILVPLVYRPKLPALGTTNESHPITGLQLLVAAELPLIIESDDVWKLRTLA